MPSQRRRRCVPLGSYRRTLHHRYLQRIVNQRGEISSRVDGRAGFQPPARGLPYQGASPRKNEKNKNKKAQTVLAESLDPGFSPIMVHGGGQGTGRTQRRKARKEQGAIDPPTAQRFYPSMNTRGYVFSVYSTQHLFVQLRVCFQRI